MAVLIARIDSGYCISATCSYNFRDTAKPADVDVSTDRQARTRRRRALLAGRVGDRQSESYAEKCNSLFAECAAGGWRRAERGVGSEELPVFAACAGVAGFSAALGEE